ncbi:MAG: lycopene cyclase family protein [Bacteroidota bacterium]
MDSIVYDYAIIGAGAAGLHLAQAMLTDDWFAEKTVLILDKDRKEVNDKTWSFWEVGVGKWDDILAKSWSKGYFNSSKERIPLDLAPYKYKTVHSIDFYNKGKAAIAQNSRYHWQIDDIEAVETGPAVTIRGKSGTYQAKQVFDSRIDRKFDLAQDNSYRILQHFKGWMVETDTPVFDDSSFVMMDFQVKWKDSTSFTYVLPFSPTKAFIEFTLFTESLIDQKDYDELLKKYLREILQLETYRVTATEFGVIPMSDFPFEQANQKGITKIGTAGAQVKASTGYAFKNIEKSAHKIIDNLKRKRAPSAGLVDKKFRFYDSLYLDILSNKNNWGETLFTQMFQRNPVQRIFRFLDDETTLAEDVKVMASFDPRPFLKAMFYRFSGIRIQ